MRRRQVSRTQTTSLARRFANSGPVLPFNPASSIPGCQLWLDAADTSTVLADGSSNVSLWIDKSNTGTIATPTRGASANQITYATVDGYPGVYINNNGSAQYNSSTYSQLTIQSNFQNTADYSIFAVVNLSNVANGPEYQTIYGNARGTSGETRTPNFGAGMTLEFNSDTTNRMINSSFIGSGRLQTALISSSSALTAYTNTTAYGSATNGFTKVSTDAGSLPSIGGPGSFNDNRFATGYFHEILIYNSVLTTIQRQKVEGYLAHKWGLTGNYNSSTPLTISGCQLWFDGADPAGTGTPPANGTTISSWADKSGNGRNATPTGTGPTYTTNIFNGYSAPVFNGTTMVTPSYLITTDSKLSIFILCKKTGLRQAGGNSDILSIAAGYQYFDLYIRTSQTNYLDLIYANTPISLTTYEISNGTNLLVTILTNGLSTSGYLNETSVFNTTAGSGGYPMNNLTSRWNISEAQFVGPICEIIIFNSTFTTTQRQTIETYLANKWGLRSSLPTNHPYKSAAPKYEEPIFLPSLITGNQLWLDAADISTITYGTGSSVASWRDKINGYAVANSSPAYQPVYSQGTIRFNGTISPSYLDIPTLTIGSSTFSIFFVIQNTGPASGNAYAPHFFWPLSGNGSGALSITSWINTNIQGVNANISSTLLKNQYYVISYTFGVTTNFEQLYANGISIGTYQNSSAYTASLYRLGTIDSSQSVTLFDGNIGEMLVYNAAVTLSQRQKIEGYLAHKWKIQSSLPANHPFKSTAPTTIPKSLTIQSLSALFSPSSKALSIPSKSSFTLGTNNHTIEFWFYQTNRTTYDVTFSYGDNPPVWTGTSTYIFQAGNPHSTCILGNGAGGWAVELFKGGNSYALNTWHHFAIVRNGTTFTLYINGTSHSTATSSVNIGPSFGSMVIGSLTSTGHVDGFTGYISNFRFVNGTAVYTSNFTPPTSPLTAIPNTQVLIQGLVDRSPNAYAVTNNGNVSLSLLSPFL